MVTQPPLSRSLTMEQMGGSQGPPRGRYNDSPNYLG